MSANSDVCYRIGHIIQEAQLMLANPRERLQVNQGHKHGTIRYVRYGFLLVFYRFSRLDKIPACDGRTDGQTDGHRTTAKTALCRASRG